MSTRKLIKLPCKECIWNGCDEGDDPDKRDDPDGALEAGHGVGVQRMADGQVSLHTKCHNRQN